ncbi:MAG: hypothetical protein RLZZ357_1833, partial [Bacteroidota bacterium]
MAQQTAYTCRDTKMSKTQLQTKSASLTVA